MSLTPGTPSTPASVSYRVGDLLIDVGIRRITREGFELELSGRTFDLLLALVRAAPNLVSTQELMDRVWAGAVVGPETVIQRIMLLRQRLGDSAENPRYVAAVRGHGYRMVAAVTELAPPPAANPSASPAFTTDQPQRSPGLLERWTRHHVALGLALALVSVLVVGGAALWWVHDHSGGSAVAASVTRPVPPRPIPALAQRSSVAVMPFANLTGDNSKDYLGDGIAEELINSLAQVPGLKVPARTSTFAYRGRNSDIRQIGRDLNVAAVLEGSVRGAGARLRVGARLVDAVSGFEIWSQDYDRQSTDLFKLQDDLAAQIVQVLRRYMNVSLPVPAAGARTTQDLQAYDLYLQGREAFRGTRPSAQPALALINKALARDPDFADALAQRAALRAFPAVFGSGPKAALDEAQHDATRALALNPRSPNGHTALEMMQAIHWHWLDAENSYRETMVTSADDPYFRDYHITFLLRAAGRMRQAESELMVSYRLAPTEGYTIHELIVTESLLEHDAEAVRLVELFRDLVAQEPPAGEDALPYLRRALRAGQYADAAKWGTRALSSSLRDAGGEATMRIFCAALADPAQRPAADRALRALRPRLVQSSDGDRVKMFFVAAFSMIGDLAGAYQLTQDLLDQRFAANGSGGVDWGEIWTPEMRAFREDTRFQVLMARVKLPEYWNAYGPPDGCDFRDGKLTCH
ncbi:MAG TPA: winged helix-turn-helix domain-containing protein [Steroidobacteraceae bacterium]